jgi:hypothetical protein
MTSLVFPAATGAMGSAGAVTAPIAVRQYIPKDIHTLPPQMQHVAEVDTSVGLLPEPEPPTRTPQKGTAAVRVTPIIVEQRFDGKVTVRMPVPENPGTDWYSDGYVTGKKGVMDQLHQVKLSNGDTINALPLGEPPLKMVKQEPIDTSTTKEATTTSQTNQTKPVKSTKPDKPNQPNHPDQTNQSDQLHQPNQPNNQPHQPPPQQPNQPNPPGSHTTHPTD